MDERITSNVYVWYHHQYIAIMQYGKDWKKV